MLQAIVIDNGIVGLDRYFQDNEKITYHFEPVVADFNPNLDPFNLLIVPNGTDQVAMAKIKPQMHDFLALGKTLFCFDGWFTDWLPGNQWVMDNSKKTIDIRYRIKTDRYNLFENVDLDAFIFSNGISGWWACGYIEAGPGADVVLEDTWQRPVMVLDEQTTNGQIFMTASGPLGDSSYATTDDPRSLGDLAKFYHNLLDKLVVPSTVSPVHNT